METYNKIISDITCMPELTPANMPKLSKRILA